MLSQGRVGWKRGMWKEERDVERGEGCGKSRGMWKEERDVERGG